ncbi:hypothetical protein [Paludibacterium denitrificans]|uniref:Uncharacterized protein n=1 Tax=Paludibacterium denitrificans TaxID=2675226 RepID=A0A844GIE8_9NEIS|nr:hypothetical protein [Paludibacterium denitrificans]MTD34245.1 hypothetical protein [Paludibacterium denitrificans]
MIPLLTRGISEKQMVFLMSEAKKANVKIQEQIKKFGKIIERYEGKTLFSVFRNFLRNPEKYLVADKKKQEKQQFTDKQRKLLILFQNMSVNDMGILRPGEKVASHEGVWTLSSPEINGGAPMPITDEMLAELEQRLADVCRKAVVNMDGHVVIPMACLPTPLIWKADEKDGKPVVYTGDKKLVGAWESIYGAFKQVYQHWSFLFGEDTQDPRQGTSFIRKGVRYLVERIAAGRALLFAERDGRTWTENIEARAVG